MKYSYYNPRRFVDTEPGILLILCRHGATAANDAEEPKVRGWDNLPLDDSGILGTQLLGHKLKSMNPKKIIHSDFMRDGQTANIIANIVATNDLESDWDLRTWDVGQFSGKTLKDVNPAIEYLYKNPWLAPPGSSETFNEFSARFTKALDKYITLATIDDFRPVVLVSHGKNIALAKTYVDGGNAWESVMPKPGGYATISVTPERTLAISIDGPTENVIEDV